MSCLKGSSLVKKDEAKFVCEKCGSQVKKKGQVCKAVKVKSDEKKSAKKKSEKKK
jgi:DNA-directed RNA polymerase subunit M/transcription elongation factor TFIIS